MFQPDKTLKVSSIAQGIFKLDRHSSKLKLFRTQNIFIIETAAQSPSFMFESQLILFCLLGPSCLLCLSVSFTSLQSLLPRLCLYCLYYVYFAASKNGPNWLLGAPSLNWIAPFQDT